MLSHLRKVDIVGTLVALGWMGVFYSRALLTISIVLLCLYGITHVRSTTVRSLLRDQAMLPLILIFLGVFLSGSYSDDQLAWKTALRIKLPFLLVPICCFFLPMQSSRWLTRMHLVLLSICTVVGIPIVISISVEPALMLEKISVGHSIPTPIEHVKYSMFNAYAVCAVIWLWVSDTLEKVEKPWALGSVTFLIVLMHLMAIRTGLVILYISVFIMGIVYALRMKKVWVSVAFSFIVVGVPLIAHQTVPTLKQKIGYMLHDWQQYQAGTGQQYSDSERIMSYQAGWNIWKNNPVLGTGYGDVRSEAATYYQSHLNREGFHKLPHSQYLLVLAGSGLLGFLLFVAGWFTPLLANEKGQLTFGLLALLYLNYSLSFMVENSLERSVSVGFFILTFIAIVKSRKTSQHES